MQQELQSRPVAFFVTLTYSEENVPCKIYDRRHLDSYHTDNFQTLSKEDVSIFIATMQKNLRCRFYAPYVSKSGKTRNGALVRYYIIGEYGDKVHVTHGTNRPHYHGIFYFPKGCSKDIAKDVLTSSWSLGIVDIQPVTFADINYVAKHQFKESKGNDYQRKHAPIFATMSRSRGGLGVDYTKFVERRHPSRTTQLYVLLNGFRLVLPQFYRKRLFPDKMTDAEMSEFRAKNFDDYGRKFAAAFGITEPSVDGFHQSQAEQGRYLYTEFRQLGFSLSNMRWRKYARQKFTRSFVRKKLSDANQRNTFLTQYFANQRQKNV